MAGYTGQQVRWEMALYSKEDLTPPSYDWNVRLPGPAGGDEVRIVAIPGR